jgi:hypothetical protein
MTVCPHCGTRVCAACGAEFEKPTKRRSNAQNALWWRYMTILGGELGYTAEEMHDACKLKLLGREDLSTGLTIIGSTKGLDTGEFTKLIDTLRRWSVESLNIYLPSPEERFWEDAA